MLCLHILQSSLAFINTLMIQDTLAEPEWTGVLGDADRRGLTPLFHAKHDPFTVRSSSGWTAACTSPPPRRPTPPAKPGKPADQPA